MTLRRGLDGNVNEPIRLLCSGAIWSKCFIFNLDLSCYPILIVIAWSRCCTTISSRLLSLPMIFFSRYYPYVIQPSDLLVALFHFSHSHSLSLSPTIAPLPLRCTFFFFPTVSHCSFKSFHLGLKEKEKQLLSTFGAKQIIWRIQVNCIIDLGK